MSRYLNPRIYIELDSLAMLILAFQEQQEISNPKALATLWESVNLNTPDRSIGPEEVEVARDDLEAVLIMYQNDDHLSDQTDWETDSPLTRLLTAVIEAKPTDVDTPDDLVYHGEGVIGGTGAGNLFPPPCEAFDGGRRE